MKKSTYFKLVLPLILFSQSAIGQRTFEAILNVTNIHGVEQNPDGTYILSFDSTSDGVMKLDACGQVVWTTFPSVRGSGEAIRSVVYDPYTGGYFAGGNSPDTSGVYDNEPTLLLLDADGNKVAHRILAPGSVGGNVTSVHITPDSGYAAGIYLDNFGGSNASSFSRFDLSLGDVWDVSGSGSDIDPSSVCINAANEYAFFSYGNTGATAPALRQIDINGLLINTFVIPDTFQGGALFFRNAVTDDLADGNFMAAATVAPMASTYDYPYLVKLDNVLNVVWQKQLDWGQSAQVLSVLGTPDSGNICMIDVSDTIVFLKLNSSGDSLWSLRYSGLGTVKANYLRPCNDGGYVLSGSTNDGMANYGFVLKLDSALRLLPPVCLNLSPSDIVCPGETITISAPPGYQYQWSTSEFSQSIDVSLPGTYSVIVTDSVTGLSAVSDPVVISNYSTSTPVINQLGILLVSTPGASYQWYFNGGTIPGETGIDMTPFATGNYTVEVTDTNGCVTISAPFPFIMPGIDRMDNQTAFSVTQISRDFLEVKITGSKQGSIMLTDMTGRIMKEVPLTSGDQSELMITVSDLSAGIYSVAWLDGSSVRVKKILLRR